MHFETINHKLLCVKMVWAQADFENNALKSIFSTPSLYPLPRADARTGAPGRAPRARTAPGGPNRADLAAEPPRNCPRVAGHEIDDRSPSTSHWQRPPRAPSCGGRRKKPTRTARGGGAIKYLLSPCPTPPAGRVGAAASGPVTPLDDSGRAPFQKLALCWYTANMTTPASDARGASSAKFSFPKAVVVRDTRATWTLPVVRSAGHNAACPL